MMDNRYKPIINNHIDDDFISVDDVRAELKGYIANGFGGIAINGRSKKKLENVQEWLPNYFETVKKYCEVAKELGLEMWIFDEWGFPTGTAAGLVLTPETRPKKLNKAIDITLEKGEEIKIPAPQRLLAVKAYAVDRFATYHPADGGRMLSVTDGMISYKADEKTRIVGVTWENTSFHTMEMRDIANMADDSTVGTIDIMDAEVVKKFIVNMHERYKAVIGDEFGKTVKGFFYDEPEICWDFPYTPSLPKYFKEKFDYDLESILPDILTYTVQDGIGLGNKEFHDHLKEAFRDYKEAYTALLAKNFYGQINEWCRENNLLSVGHQDMDHDVLSIDTVSGSFFKNSVNNDMPGIDVIWDQIIPEKFADFPRFAGSVKRAYKKCGAMSETFAVMGVNMPPDVMRYDMIHQIVRGIDKFFLYLNASDPDAGDYKRDVMCCAAEVAKMLNEGEENAKVALLIPMSDINYKRMVLNPHVLTESPTAWDRLKMTAEALCYAPIDFDYVWEEALDNLYERGFRELILTGSPVNDAALKGIKKFREQGGKVLSVFKASEQFNFDEFYYYLPRLMEKLPCEVKVVTDNKRISLSSRKTKDGVIYAMLNETEREARCDITFPEGDVSYYDMNRKLWCGWDGNGTFAPRELKLFRVGKKADIIENVVEVKDLDKWKFNGNEISSLVPWEEMGLKGFSGYGEYETEFDWDGGIARISLGEVRFSAEVSLDGKEYKLPFSPWIFQTELSKGKHILKVKVKNTGAPEYYATPDIWHRPYEQPYLLCGMLGDPKIEKVEIAD